MYKWKGEWCLTDKMEEENNPKDISQLFNVDIWIIRTWQIYNPVKLVYKYSTVGLRTQCFSGFSDSFLDIVVQVLR